MDYQVSLDWRSYSEHIQTRLRACLGFRRWLALQTYVCVIQRRDVSGVDRRHRREFSHRVGTGLYRALSAWLVTRVEISTTRVQDLVFHMLPISEHLHSHSREDQADSSPVLALLQLMHCVCIYLWLVGDPQGREASTRRCPTSNKDNMSSPHPR